MKPGRHATHSPTTTVQPVPENMGEATAANTTRNVRMGKRQRMGKPYKVAMLHRNINTEMMIASAQ